MPPRPDGIKSDVKKFMMGEIMPRIGERPKKGKTSRRRKISP